MFKRKSALALSLLTIFLITFVAGCGSSTNSSDSKAPKEVKKIKLGIVNALTGPMGAAGTSIVNGAKMAVDKINGDGGVTINGEKYLLEPIVQDDRGDPKESVAVFEKMIADGVKYFSGPMPSSSSIAVGPILQKNQGINMNISLSAESAKWPYTFSSHIDGSKVDFIGKYMFNKLSLKKIAVLTAQNDMGITTATSVKRGFTAAGGQIVTEEFFKLDDKDIYAQLTKIKNLKPDAVFVAGYGDAVALAYKQAYELKAVPVIVGQVGLSTADMLKLMPKEAAQGIYELSPADLSQSLAAKDPQAEKFLADFQTKFGKDAPMGSSLYGFDGIMFMAEAMTRANSTDISKVRDALEGLIPPDNTWKWQPIRKYYSQNGKLYDAIHKVSLKNVVQQFKGDGFQFVEWLE